MVMEIFGFGVSCGVGGDEMQKLFCLEFLEGKSGGRPFDVSSFLCSSSS